MYAALMTGIANHLCNCFDYEPNRVKFGGTDDYWSRFKLDKIETPGLIYGASSINFPKGFSAHTSEYLGGTNTSENIGLKVRPVLFNVNVSLGMIASNEDDHFHQIHKYVEMATFHARLCYRVIVPGIGSDYPETWESTITDFSELSPAPSMYDTDTKDVEGKLYKLEGTFTVNSQFFFTEEEKIVRCIFVNGNIVRSDHTGADLESLTVIERETRIVGKDSVGNKFPNAVEPFKKERK